MTSTAMQRARMVLSLDDDDHRAIVSAQPDRLTTLAPPVLVDEWQKLPSVWDRVRRAVDDDPSPARFLLTGSTGPAHAPVHSGAGRIADLTRYIDEILRSCLPAAVTHELAETGVVVRRPAALMCWLVAYAAATSTTASYETILAAATPAEGSKPSKVTALGYRDALAQLPGRDTRTARSQSSCGNARGAYDTGAFAPYQVAGLTSCASDSRSRRCALAPEP